MNKWIHISIIWALTWAVLSAQDSFPTQRYLQEPMVERSFDKAAWQKAKEGIDFKDEIRVDRYDEDFFDEEDTTQQKRTASDGGSGSSPIMGFIFKGLLVLGAIALLGFLLSKFLGSGGITLRRNRKVDNRPLNVSLEKVEAELLESDVDRMLRLAIEENNYPLALRLKYLAVIKGLFLNGYTQWKKDKTNRQYLREIKDPERKEEFRKLTLAYERIWYGRSEINETEYAQLEPDFSSFLKKIEANPLHQFESV